MTPGHPLRSDSPLQVEGGVTPTRGNGNEPLDKAGAIVLLGLATA